MRLDIMNGAEFDISQKNSQDIGAAFYGNFRL